MQKKDLTFELKESTKYAHEAIEALTFMKKLQAVDASPVDYQMMAKVMFPKFWQLEHHLLAMLKELSLSRNAIIPLALECKQKGISMPSIDILPENKNFLIALLYVLEGANLGAKFLMISWQKIFPEQDIDGMHYYNYLSSLPSFRWTKIKEILNTFPLSEEERQEVLKYAEEIFLFLGGQDDVFKSK